MSAFLLQSPCIELKGPPQTTGSRPGGSIRAGVRGNRSTPLGAGKRDTGVNSFHFLQGNLPTLLKPSWVHRVSPRPRCPASPRACSPWWRSQLRPPGPSPVGSASGTPTGSPASFQAVLGTLLHYTFPTLLPGSNCGPHFADGEQEHLAGRVSGGTRTRSQVSRLPVPCSYSAVIFTFMFIFIATAIIIISIFCSFYLRCPIEPSADVSII